MGQSVSARSTIYNPPAATIANRVPGSSSVVHTNANSRETTSRVTVIDTSSCPAPPVAPPRQFAVYEQFAEMEVGIPAGLSNSHISFPVRFEQVGRLHNIIVNSKLLTLMPDGNVLLLERDSVYEGDGDDTWNFVYLGNHTYFIKNDRKYLGVRDGTLVLMTRADVMDQLWKVSYSCPATTSTSTPPATVAEPRTPPPPPPIVPITNKTKVPTSAADSIKKMMGLTIDQVDTILRLVSLPENSRQEWWKNYNFIKDIRDGRGFTVTLFGACSGTGDLLMIFEALAKIQPSHPLVRFIPELRKKRGADTKGIEGIEPIIKNLGEDTAWQEAVWRVYVDLYWSFVSRFVAKTGDCAKRPGPVLTLPVSKGFLLDTSINHGADMYSLNAVLKRMPSSKRDVQDEREWMEAFIDTRKDVLVAGIGNLDSSGSGNRCDLWKKLFDINNINLARPIKANRGYWGSNVVIE